MPKPSYDLWLCQKRQLLEEHSGIVIIRAAEAYGANFLIETFSGSAMPLVWVEFTEQDKDDDIAQGNRFVEAVQRQLGDLKLPFGMPFSYGVNMLKSHLAFIGPLTLAASNLHFAPEVASTLLSFAKTGNWVVLSYDGHDVDDYFPEEAKVIEKEDLFLSYEEALDLSEGLVDEQEVKSLVEACNYALISFQTHLATRLQLQPIVIPSPTGPRLPVESGVIVKGEALVRLFASKGRYQEALELAVESCPHEVVDIIEEAGHVYHQRGMHKRLYTLLSQVPDDLLKHEYVLFWLLMAAFRVNKHDTLFTYVEQYLLDHEAPHVRSACAGIFPSAGGLKEAQRAYHAQPTAYTCFQYGRLLEDTEQAVNVHMEGLQIAERYNRSYEITRAAGELTNKLISNGEFEAAIYWGNWALKHYDEAGLSDYARRLTVENNLAYARLLCGITGGLEANLKQLEKTNRQVFPDIARRYQSTLAEYLLVDYRATEALVLARSCFESAPRRLIGDYGLYLIRILIELEEFETALNIGKEVYYLTRDLPSSRRYAELALGMALTMTNPEKAKAYLEQAANRFTTGLEADHLIQASLYLIKVHLEQQDKKTAQAILAGIGEWVKDLSEAGLRLLGGPTKLFWQVYSLVRGWEVPLEIKLLGESQLWLEGETLKLSLRELEVLTVLIIKNRAISLNDLATAFGGNFSLKANLKGDVARLRKKLPISQKHYQLTLPYRADFIDILTLIQEGKYPEAFKLYKGSLLPQSDVELIREYDNYIFESLRQVALNAGFADYYLTLMDYASDDLELAEAALNALDSQDSRRLLVQAYILNIKENWAI